MDVKKPCKTYGGSSEKLNIELYDSVIHFWVYTQEVKAGTHTDICTPMFTAALFTIAKMETPKCP